MHALEETIEYIFGCLYPLDLASSIGIEESIKLGGGGRVGKGARDGDGAVEAKESR
jgi:hypothetical protein